MDQPAAKRPCLVDPVIATVNYAKVITKVVDGMEESFTVCGTCSGLLRGAQPTQHSKNQHESSKAHKAGIRMSNDPHKQRSILDHARPWQPGGRSGSAPASEVELPIPAIEPTAEVSLPNQAVVEVGVINPGSVDPTAELPSSTDLLDGSDDGLASGNCCQGYHLKLPAEDSAFYRHFPFQIMGESKVSEVFELKGSMLFSVSCQRVGVPCTACSGLARNSIVRGIEERAKNGTPMHTAYSLLSYQGFLDLVARKDDALNRVRLQGLNDGRRGQRPVSTSPAGPADEFSAAGSGLQMPANKKVTCSVRSCGRTIMVCSSCPTPVIRTAGQDIEEDARTRLR